MRGTTRTTKTSGKKANFCHGFGEKTTGKTAQKKKFLLLIFD
jgi:hypothetical protein